MAAWWKPTAEGYFRHIAKPAILEAVSQYAPAHVTRLSKLKKGDIASEAERLAEGSGWMPAVFHIDHDPDPEGAPAAAEAAPPEDDDDAGATHGLETGRAACRGRGG